MSEQAPAPVSAPKRTLKPMEVVIFGKVLVRRQMQTTEGKRVMTLIRCPAPDQYSHPSTVEISSVNSLGAPDEEINVVCRLEGSPNNFDTKDKDTGEVRRVHSARHFLRAVEF